MKDHWKGEKKRVENVLPRVRENDVETEREREREKGIEREKVRKKKRTAQRGVKTEASPPGGPSAPEKRVNIDPFFYLSHPQVFHPRYFFFPRLQGSPSVARWHDRDGISVSIATLYPVRSFLRPSVSPLVRSSVERPLLRIIPP